MASGRDTSKRRAVKVNITVMITATLVVLVAVFAILFIYQYQVLRDTIEQERVTYVSEIKDQLVDNIAMERNMQISTVNLYRRNILKAQSERFADLADILEGTQLDEGDAIFFLDENGTVYDLNGNKRHLSDQMLAQRLLLDRTGVFSYAQINNMDEYWFYGIPLEGVTLDGVPIRAVLSARNIQNFGSGMATNILNNEGFTFVTSKKGNVLLFPPSENDMGYSLFNSLLSFGASEEAVNLMREDFAQGRDGQKFLFYGSNRWLISYSSDVFDDWVVVVLMPMTITAADTYRMLNYTMLVVALLVGSILLLLLFSINLFYQRERAREQAVQQEKLELEIIRRTAESKNQFLAKMSHDIRTPLNAIIGLLQIAKNLVTGQSKIEKNLFQVEQSAEYLLSVLNDILDMSKIESGKMQLNKIPFSLEKLLETVDAVNRTQADRKNLDFRVETQGDLSPCNMGDPLRLKQILMNLLSNAIKFTEQGGVVLLQVTVLPEDDEDKLVFVVEDTGIGMSKEYLKNLFQPFEQESPSVAATYAGSGLGLSIVKNLAELMDGKLSVSSTKGKGSRFEVSLCLPRAEAQEYMKEDCEQAPSKISLAGRKLLLAEDNELNAMIATELITTQYGMQVDWTENGQLAVERFAASALDEYAAILMDIRMPVMDGLEATAAIRKLDHPRAGTVPIIAMSANAFAEDVALSLECGMNDHLAKPIDITKLESFLKTYIEKEETICI